MCQIPSWRTLEDGTVLFPTDKDALRLGLNWKDAGGHTAISKIYPGSKGKDGEGLGKDTPPEVVKAIHAGKMNKLIEQGELLIRDGKWKLLLTTAGNVYVDVSGEFDAPALTTAGNVYVYVDGKFDAPKLKKK